MVGLTGKSGPFKSADLAYFNRLNLNMGALCSVRSLMSSLFALSASWVPNFAYI